MIRPTTNGEKSKKLIRGIGLMIIFDIELWLSYRLHLSLFLFPPILNAQSISADSEAIYYSKAFDVV